MLMLMRQEARSLQFWRAIIAECLAAFLYVFLVCGSHVSWPPPSSTSIPSSSSTPVSSGPLSSSSIHHVSSSIIGRTHGGSSSSSSSTSSGGSSQLSMTTPSMSTSFTSSYSSWNVQAALTSGFAMSTVLLCFGRISGGHINPALTLTLMVTRRVTPLRAFFYITAQCGGSIAGAALLYGVSVPGHLGTLGATRIHDLLTPWQGFGVEMILAFSIVFAAFAASEVNLRQQNYKTNNIIVGQHWTKLSSMSAASLSPSPLIGAAYLVCTLAGLPSTGAALSPARALGPAFVMNRWENHWVYWLGPMSGGLLAGLLYEYIFDPRRNDEVEMERENRELRMALDNPNRGNSSLHSQDDDYDDPNDVALNQGVPKTNGPSSNRLCVNYNGHPRSIIQARPIPVPPSPPPPPLPLIPNTGNNNNYRSSQQLARGQHYDTYRANHQPVIGSHYGRGVNAEPTYGTLASNGPYHHNSKSNYGNAESLYGSSTATSHRPQSNISGNYATIHGNRPGTGGGSSLMLGASAGSTGFSNRNGATTLHRLDYAGPDTTKF